MFKQYQLKNYSFIDFLFYVFIYRNIDIFKIENQINNSMDNYFHHAYTSTAPAHAGAVL